LVGMGAQPKPSARFSVQRTSSCKSTLWQKSSETKFFQVNGKVVTQKSASPGHSGELGMFFKTHSS